MNAGAKASSAAANATKGATDGPGHLKAASLHLKAAAAQKDAGNGDGSPQQKSPAIIGRARKGSFDQGGQFRFIGRVSPA